jgi:hypothetical protein
MAALLVLATVIDLALAALLISVSGFVLEGVNNTGPTMPDAAFLVAFIIFSVAAPLAAWARKSRARPATTLITAWAPPAIAAIALLLEPLLA